MAQRESVHDFGWLDRTVDRVFQCRKTAACLRAVQETIDGMQSPLLGAPQRYLACIRFRGIWLGGYRDVNESNVLQGRIGSVKLFHLCAKPSWVAHEFEHGADLVALPAEGPAEMPLPIDATPEMVIKPYL